MSKIILKIKNFDDIYKVKIGQSDFGGKKIKIKNLSDNKKHQIKINFIG